MQNPLFRVGKMVQAVSVFEACKLEALRGAGKVRLAGAGLYTGQLDVSYLQFCSQAYEISADPRDYVIVDLPIVESDIPNRNMDAFPYQELTSFNTVVGAPVWRTFCWKPTFADHQNQDPKTAKGVIFDSLMKRVGKTQHIVRILAGFDRGKDPKLVADILSGKRNAYSMGALASYVACSCHGQVYDGNPASACPEIRKGKGRIIEMAGRGEVLVHDCCYGVNFVETSSVEDPAYFGAQSDLVLQS
jgi:hypothetical protein